MACAGTCKSTTSVLALPDAVWFDDIVCVCVVPVVMPSIHVSRYTY